MINIIKQEFEIDEALIKKLRLICSFCNTGCKIEKSSIKTIERTNLSYVKLHEIIINHLITLSILKTELIVSKNYQYKKHMIIINHLFLYNN